MALLVTAGSAVGGKTEDGSIVGAEVGKDSVGGSSIGGILVGVEVCTETEGRLPIVMGSSLAVCCL